MSGNNLSIYQLKQPDRSGVVPQTGDLWEDDKLDRKDAGERLANMIAGQVGPLVIGLNGRWGEGKTFFLKRFRKLYEDRHACAVYFNAWQDDYLDDPLLSLLCQLRSSIERLPQETFVASAKETVVSVLKHAGVAMFKSFVKNVAKVDIDALSPEELETRSEKLFEEYQTASASRDKLVGALESLARTVHEKSGAPLVVIVDELDRCRPSFAIEMLERIKHLFAIENVVFVLGVDRTQLESSIASVYGDIDTQGYLQRFIDVEFRLPRTSLYRFLQERLEQSNVAQAIHPVNGMQIVNSFFRAFCAIADAENLPPRAVEHGLRKFALVSCANDHDSRTWTVLTAFAVGLSLLPNKRLYGRFMDGDFKPKEIVDAVFPDFRLEDSTLSGPGSAEILYLYKIYYHASGDVKFKEDFDKNLEEARNHVRSDHLLTQFPSFTINTDPEEVYSFFQHVTDRVQYSVSLKYLLNDLREAMSSVVEFATVPNTSANE